MVKKAVKNYFVNLKYFFTPLGTLALGLIIGLSVFLPGAKTALSDLVASIQDILSSAVIDVEHLEESLLDAVKSLDWSQPLSAVGTIFDSQWLTDTLNNSILPFVENAEQYAGDLMLAIETFTVAMIALVVVAAFFVAVGFIAGFLLIKWLIRRDIARRSIVKYLFISPVDAILAGAMIALCTWIYSLSHWLTAVAIAIGLVLSGGISLIEAYLVHGRGKVDVKAVVNAKNVFKLYCGDLLILLIASAFSALVYWLINAAAAAILGLIFFEIALIVIDLNAEAYVKSLAEGTAID